MTRAQVFKLIDGERAHQERYKQSRSRRVAEYLTWMTHYLHVMIEVDSTLISDAEHFLRARGAMRKFAALGVMMTSKTNRLALLLFAASVLISCADRHPYVPWVPPPPTPEDIANKKHSDELKAEATVAHTLAEKQSEVAQNAKLDCEAKAEDALAGAKESERRKFYSGSYAERYPNCVGLHDEFRRAMQRVFDTNSASVGLDPEPPRFTPISLTCTTGIAAWTLTEGKCWAYLPTALANDIGLSPGTSCTRSVIWTDQWLCSKPAVSRAKQ